MDKEVQKKGIENGRKLALIVGCGIGNVKPYFNPKSLWLKRPWNSRIYHHHVLQKEKDVILI